MTFLFARRKAVQQQIFRRGSSIGNQEKTLTGSCLFCRRKCQLEERGKFNTVHKTLFDRESFLFFAFFFNFHNLFLTTEDQTVPRLWKSWWTENPIHFQFETFEFGPTMKAIVVCFSCWFFKGGGGVASGSNFHISRPWRWLVFERGSWTVSSFVLFFQCPATDFISTSKMSKGRPVRRRSRAWNK